MDKEQFEKDLKIRGFGERFFDRTFEGYKVNKDNESMYLACKGFVEKYDTYRATGTGLLLYGDIGLGKTHLVHSIATKLAETRNIWSYFVNAPEFLSNLRLAMNKKEMPDIFKIANEYTLLIIDDIGKEKPSDWVSEQFYILVNSRYNSKKPTIFTTNKGEKELSENIGPATISRIYEMTEQVGVTGKDFRKGE